MKKSLAVAGALAVIALAPSANAFSFKMPDFGGAFRSLAEKAKSLSAPARNFINQAREFATGAIKNAGAAIKSAGTGLRNDLFAAARGFIAQNIANIKGQLPEIGKGLRSLLGSAVQKGWEQAKQRFAAGFKNAKGKGLNRVWGGLKLGFSGAWKGFWKTGISHFKKGGASLVKKHLGIFKNNFGKSWKTFQKTAVSAGKNALKAVRAGFKLPKLPKFSFGGKGRK